MKTYTFDHPVLEGDDLIVKVKRIEPGRHWVANIGPVGFAMGKDALEHIYKCATRYYEICCEQRPVCGFVDLQQGIDGDDGWDLTSYHLAVRLHPSIVDRLADELQRALKEAGIKTFDYDAESFLPGYDCRDAESVDAIADVCREQMADI